MVLFEGGGEGEEKGREGVGGERGEGSREIGWGLGREDVGRWKI